MKKIQDFVLKGKEVFVGLEDSKKSWKVCVRSGRLGVQRHGHDCGRKQPSCRAPLLRVWGRAASTRVVAQDKQLRWEDGLRSGCNVK